jgi:hypothetical protein
MAVQANDWLTLVPAYGRDYQTAEAVLAHWKEGRDFRIQDISCRWNGSYTSCRDHGPDASPEMKALESVERTTFKVRYCKLANFVLIRHDGTEWVVTGVSDGSEVEEVCDGTDEEEDQEVE